MPRLIRWLVAFALSLGVAAPVSAQDFGGTSDAYTSPTGVKNAAHVKVALSANRAAVAPGESFLLALTLDHPKGWHTYWKNPGDAGSPTSIAWSKDGGATFGERRYPAPHLYAQGDILNFVFDGKAALLIPVTAPASLKFGDTFELAGQAEWLECDDSSCHPQSAALSLAIPVTEKPESANEALFTAAEKAIPKPAPAGSATLKFKGKDVVGLRLAPAILTGLDAGSARFFPTSEAVPAIWTATGPVVSKDGALFTFKDAEKVIQAKKLSGVITFASGDAVEIDALPETITTTDPVLISERISVGAEAYGLPALLALAFGGGILLNIMPCVFPVLGLKIYGFVDKAHKDRRKVVSHALAFAGGIVISFWILAAVIIGLKSGALTFLGGSGADIGWGFLLQIPGFVAGIAILFLVMGLGMAGVFEFGTGVQNVASAVEDKGGYFGSFLSGALATLVATPCSGPGIAPALGAAFAAPPAVAFAIFTAMALGLASPFVVFACSPALLKKLPRPGAWMESFKQAMAFLLFGSFAYFVWILGAQTEGLAFLVVLFALVAISAACWIYGRWCVPSKETRVRRLGAIFAALFLLGGCIAIAKAIPDRDLSGTSVTTGIVWEEWSPETQAKHLAAGETVYVDFTARWCATCQVNKRVFQDPSVQKAFATNKVVALKADWTKSSPVIARELARYGRSAIPFNVVLKKNAEPKTLPEALTANAVLEALGLE